jgi:hypothetical protein
MTAIRRIEIRGSVNWQPSRDHFETEVVLIAHRGGLQGDWEMIIAQLRLSQHEVLDDRGQMTEILH